MGLGWYNRVETPALPKPSPPPGRSRPPICCPRCIPIRRISQPRGSGYRRLNDKVPPLPARPASRPAGTRSGFSTLSPRPRKNSKRRDAQNQPVQSSGEAEARAAGAADCRLQIPRGVHLPQPFHAQQPSFLASSPLWEHSLQPGSGTHSLAPPGSALLTAPVPLPRPRPGPEASLPRGVSQQTCPQSLPNPPAKPQVPTAPGNLG